MIGYKNLLEGIQGNWTCSQSLNHTKSELLNLEFSIVISENLISRNGEGDEFWPSISSFELVGPIKEGFFYREDGHFMQVKSLTGGEMEIELSHKGEDGKLNTYIFEFKKEID